MHTQDSTVNLNWFSPRKKQKPWAIKDGKTWEWKLRGEINKGVSESCIRRISPSLMERQTSREKKSCLQTEPGEEDGRSSWWPTAVFNQWLRQKSLATPALNGGWRFAAPFFNEILLHSIYNVINKTIKKKKKTCNARLSEKSQWLNDWMKKMKPHTSSVNQKSRSGNTLRLLRDGWWSPSICCTEVIIIPQYCCCWFISCESTSDCSAAANHSFVLTPSLWYVWHCFCSNNSNRISRRTGDVT